MTNSKMFNVESSMFKQLGYSEQQQLLLVRFNNDTLYAYTDVPAELWDALQAADSMGQFFARNIRTKFLFERFE